MLAYYAKRSQGEDFERLSTPLSTGVWVDGSHMSIEELNKLTAQYELDANIVYDVRDRQELPRVEFSGSDVYTFLRLPHLASNGHVVAAPILCITRKDMFFSVSMSDTVSPESIAATTLPVSTRRTQDLLLGVIAACVASYEDLMKHTERSINDTAARLKTHEVTNQDFIHFVTVEDNLTSYRMNLGGILAVVERHNSTKHESLNDTNHEALEDISLHIQQLLVAVESYAGRVESIRNAYSTIANNTLNQRMKTLTVFTVLITVPNVFYGMFGMNVPIPFQTSPWAYVSVVSFTVILTIIVYIVAKWRKIF